MTERTEHAGESFAHVLNNYNVYDPELTQLLKVAIGETRHAGSHGEGWGYKEVQIHGPLDLRRDVACLFVNRKHKDDAELMKRVEAFRIRNKCEVVIMERLKGADDMGDDEENDEDDDEEEI